MRTIAKPILTAGAILIAALLAACLALNAFLALPATREMIQREIGKAAGIPVTFGSLIGLPYPLGAIRIAGIKAGKPDKLTSFAAPSITIRPELPELLMGKLVIAELDLKAPSLRLSSALSMGISPAGFGGSPSVASPLPPPPPITAETSQKNLNEAPTASSSQSSVANKVAPHLPLRSIRISGGDFSYLDGKGRPIVTLKGVALDGSMKNAAWRGTFRANATVIGSNLIVRNLKASVSAPEDLSTLVLTPFTASLGGGTISGKVALSSLQQIPEYSLSLHLADARLGRLLVDSAAGTSSAEGEVGGDLLLTGTVGRGSTMNGEGNLLCKEVVIEPVSFLKQIGQILSVDELKLLRLAEGKCLFRVDQGRFVVDDLLLRSENLVLAATGPMDSRGELNLDSRLLFNEKLTGRLRGLLGNKLTPAPEPGYSQITFRVTGPALNPKTDLLERLTGIRIGGDLGGVGGLIQGLFGAPKPKQQPPPPAP